jgi:uncharacterized surface protein with fasciclin (FAS1) repeats
MRGKLAIIAVLVAMAISSAVAGTNNPVVGGKEMYPAKNIIQNAVNSADHTTLVAAGKTAGLVVPSKVQDRLQYLLPPTKLSTSFQPGWSIAC